MMLSHLPQTVLLSSLPFCFVVYFLFRRFVVLETLLFRRFVLPSGLSFSRFRLVVLHLKQRREPRGALLFALKGETYDEIHRRRFLSLSG